jgi:hypothetical protein
MEVIDAKYRNSEIRFASSQFNSSLTDFSNTSGNDGSFYVYEKKNHSISTALSGFTNALICSQWRNLYSDKTAKANTNTWMTYSQCNTTTYAPGWCRAITTDGGNWDIPNLFQLIVIYCCSDMLDEMDPTFSANKAKGLGYASTNGRFRISNGGNIWSSTEYSNSSVRAVHYYGVCQYANKDTAQGCVPVREL